MDGECNQAIVEAVASCQSRPQASRLFNTGGAAKRAGACKPGMLHAPPPTTLPNTECLKLRCGALLYRMKNWLQSSRRVGQGHRYARDVPAMKSCSQCRQLPGKHQPCAAGQGLDLDWPADSIEHKVQPEHGVVCQAARLLCRPPAIGVGPAVGHAEHSASAVQQAGILLVLEGGTIDGLAPCPRTSGIAALQEREDFDVSPTKGKRQRCGPFPLALCRLLQAGASKMFLMLAFRGKSHVR